MNNSMPLLKNKILNALLDKYESSKSFTGENLVNQSFSIKPDFIMPSYYSDFADIDALNDFHSAIRQIENEGLIRLEYNKGVLKRIVANENRIKDFYAALDRRPLDVMKLERINHLDSMKGKHSLIDSFINSEIDKLNGGYKTFIDDSELDAIISLLNYILDNTAEILERELSISVLGDSKLFEKKYRHKICRILNDFSEDNVSDADFENQDLRLWEIETLADYMVVPNPSYIFFKGDGTISFNSGNVIHLNHAIPIAISSQALREYADFKIKQNVILTVENLTSFNRLNCDDKFLIYLEGYHSKSKQKLLTHIASNNDKIIEFYHFGDIDPDGFMILQNLRSKTGIDFKPYKMGTAELCAYTKVWKQLTALDRKKAESMLDKDLYTDVITFMLDHNCKLEQEIISLNHSDNSL